MSRALRVTSTAVVAAGVLAVMALGLMVHAASALLAFTPSGVVRDGSQPERAATPYSAPGRHAVGMRSLPAQGRSPALTVWYPAMPPLDPSGGHRPAGVRYAYGMTAIDPGANVALATYPGRAIPAAATDVAAGPYPVVVLSPGFAIGVSSYGWLAEHLASHGFVVAGVRHVEALNPEELWKATADRPRDVTLALDRIADESASSGPLAGLLDIDRVAVLGHSYGGYTALSVGGARLSTAELLTACESDGGPHGVLSLQCDALVPHLDELAARWGLSAVPSGAWPTPGDPRVDAVVALAGDAAMFGAEGLASVSVPLLAIGGTSDADAPFVWGTRAAYEYATSPRRAEVALVGAEHLVFAGACEAPRIALSGDRDPVLRRPGLGARRRPPRRRPVCDGIPACRAEQRSSRTQSDWHPRTCPLPHLWSIASRATTPDRRRTASEREEPAMTPPVRQATTGGRHT